ncbi:hypothetical protein ZORO111903_04310 [Zobellia roscoffensis]
MVCTELNELFQIKIEKAYFKIRYNNVSSYGKTLLMPYICELFRLNPNAYDSSI